MAGAFLRTKIANQNGRQNARGLVPSVPFLGWQNNRRNAKGQIRCTADEQHVCELQPDPVAGRGGRRVSEVEQVELI